MLLTGKENFMNCTSCGKPLKPNTGFCTGCGTSISAASPSTNRRVSFKHRKRLCHSCGSPLRPDSRFCNGCGAQVKAQSRAWSILTGVLYVILGVVGISWNLISSNVNGTDVKTPGWNFLTAAGALYIILGAIGTLMSLIIFRKETFASTVAFIVILNIWTFVIGIIGMKYRQYFVKAKLLQNLAIIDLVLLGILLFFVPIPKFSRLIIIFSLIFGKAAAGFFLPLFLYIVEFAMPVCYLIGARKNLKLA